MDLYKYSVIFSNTLFLCIAFVLIKHAESGYSPRTHTISKTIQFLKNPRSRLMFQVNFFLKAFLDAGFWWYLVHSGTVTPFSLPSFLLISGFLCFGALGYITEEKNHLLHRHLIMYVITCWCLLEVILAWYTGDRFFTSLSLVLAAILFVLSMWAILKRKVTVYVQLFCVSLVYLWLFLYVWK